MKKKNESSYLTVFYVKHTRDAQVLNLILPLIYLKNLSVKHGLLT